jgi:hypothetical protein
VIPLAFENADGTPFDLTGGSARFVMIPVSLWNAAEPIVKTSPLGIQPTDAVAANLVLDAVDSSTLDPGAYRYGAKAFDVAGKGSTQILGTILCLDNPAR